MNVTSYSCRPWKILRARGSVHTHTRVGRARTQASLLSFPTVVELVRQASVPGRPMSSHKVHHRAVRVRPFVVVTAVARDDDDDGGGITYKADDD